MTREGGKEPEEPWARPDSEGQPRVIQRPWTIEDSDKEGSPFPSSRTEGPHPMIIVEEEELLLHGRRFERDLEYKPRRNVVMV